MSGYNEIRGLRVKYLSDDPANPENGQVWYNSTTGNLRVQGIGVAAWSSAAPTINARSGASHGGTQTAAIISGGGDLTSTEEYNGSGWSAGGALNTGRTNAGGAGIQTATLVFGGTIGSPNTYQTVNESYDGTSWTEEADISTARYNVGNGCGTQTSALYSGGYNNSNLDSTEEWNGTAWTAGGAYPTIIRDFPLVGTQDAALGFGGFTPPAPGSKTPGLANSYDGSTWTSITAMNTGRATLTGGGIQTYAIGAAGYSTPTTSATANTEIWDGTSWTESADLATPRFNIAGSKSGTASAFLGCTGYTPGSQTSLTEEFNFSSSTFTPAAWSSGGNLSQARTEFAAAQNSTQDAGLVFGGFDGSTTIYNATEEYNGSAWSSGGNLPQGLRVPGGAGTQTAGLSVAGRNGPSPTARINNTYEYDGAAWTAGGNYPATQAYTGATGTQTTALAFGGENPAGTDLTTSNHYDGSTWTAGGTLNTAGYNNRGFGSSTSALCAFRAGPPTGLETESYDGSTWTSVNSMNQPTVQGGSAGSYPNGLAFGGATPGINTEGWDGTNWSTRPNMTTARRCEGFGTETAGVAAGGETPGSPTSATTEEFTGETVAANPANNIDVS